MKGFFARAQGSKQLDGEKMLDYFKSKFGIYVCESIFMNIRKSLQAVLEEYELISASISERSTLKNLLSIYIAHIGCLRPLKIAIRQIMSNSEMIEQQKLLEQLQQKIKLFPNQEKNPQETAVLEPEQCFQLHIFHLAKQAVNEMSDLISTKTVEEKLTEMADALRTFKGKSENSDIIRMLKRYQGSEFAEVMDQEASVLKKMKEVFEICGELLNERLGGRFEEMLRDKSKIEDTFQGFGTEETQRLVEFLYLFMQEVLVNYGNQHKAILDNQPNKDAGEDEAEAEEKKAKALREATAQKTKLNDFVYECMIQGCANFKDVMRKVSKIIMSADFAGFEDDDMKKFFERVDSLLTGKSSLMKAIMTFVLVIQLYEVGTTDLDEVSEALFNAQHGFSFYIAASEIMHKRKPEIEKHNGRILEEFNRGKRFVCFGLSKVAARLVNGTGTRDKSDLLKFKILNHGICENYIPILSESCKKEIEGSFKITGDVELQQKALAPPESCEKTDE